MGRCHLHEVVIWETRFAGLLHSIAGYGQLLLLFHFFCSFFVRASSVMLSMWCCKNVSHGLLVYFLLTLPTKLKLGQQTGGRLLIGNHLDKSLWLVNQKQAPAVQSYSLHSSVVGVRLSCAFYQRQETVQKYWGKTIFLSWTCFFWAEPACFDFSSSNFNLQG